MPLVVVITRDVESRYRGFLGSAMLELAPGVYAQPRMSAGGRTRIADVLSDWHSRLQRGSIVMCWAEPKAHGGLGLRTWGTPPRDIVTHDAMLLVRRACQSPRNGEDAGQPDLSKR
ncbi:type I-E CRISPR-associated endoribonuclease Cas2 [Novosphingobium sp. PC22D]|uniref:type I-E CRISPR-associated endoribonuclease Cas2e n=1 Tax=Novosphingobium sp. PC22D TaxID=1962403 RepID=UPI000BF0560E|nr:type I-E CRISPR-associated endoribonuclease Cas2e [Novosphingobium sp. PC22D]PEQ12683.1 type I-E CRISPR-associated endoribonuclease Cas2 [Novosphingobium sp. PC22D]